MSVDPGRLQRMDEAARWLQRLHLATDEGALDEWLGWCQRDARNQKAFDELVEIWEVSGGLHDETPVTVAAVTPLRTAPSRPARRFALAASLAGLGLAVVAGGALWKSRVQPDQVAIQQFASPVGLNSTHTLQDGSVLELGAGSSVTASFSAHARRLELHEGELFVAVEKDTSRPFSVEAGRLEVVATGTSFNVLRTDERTTVTVAEGSVDALYEGQGAQVPNVSLQTNQQLVYSHGSGRVVVREANPEEALAWRSGTLRFQNEPLSEVIAKVGRYTAVPIQIDDAQVAALLFTGTARADHIDGWLRGLPHVFPVTVQLTDGRYRIALKRGAGAD